MRLNLLFNQFIFHWGNKYTAPSYVRIHMPTSHNIYIQQHFMNMMKICGSTWKRCYLQVSERIKHTNMDIRVVLACLECRKFWFIKRLNVKLLYKWFWLLRNPPVRQSYSCLNRRIRQIFKRYQLANRRVTLAKIFFIFNSGLDFNSARLTIAL